MHFYIKPISEVLPLLFILSFVSPALGANPLTLTKREHSSHCETYTSGILTHILYVIDCYLNIRSFLQKEYINLHYEIRLKPFLLFFFFSKPVYF